MVSVGSESSSGRVDSASVSTEVVTAVAAAKEMDPLSLPPLYEAIDPDALDGVAACDTVGVSFEYAGYAIHIDGQDAIALKSLGG